jgi:adenine/guanine/hypoxanthine permease
MMKKMVRDFFRLEERGTTATREFRCGTATFLTMSYILLVNPQLLSKLGVPSTDIAVSTAIAAAVGSLTVGLFGNLPFGLAPGVGLSAYLTYGLVAGQGMTIAQAFTSVRFRCIDMCDPMHVAASVLR